MTPQRAAEHYAKLLLEHWGFEVRRIPEESGRKTPDLDARDRSGQRYLVEVTTRSDSEDFLETLSDGRYALAAPKTEPSSSVAKRAHQKNDQIAAEAERIDEPWFGLTVIRCLGRDPEGQRDVIVSTLYGSIDTVVWGLSPKTRPTYYLTPPAFRTLRMTNAVLVIVRDEVQLLVNEFARSADAFLFSGLALELHDCSVIPAAQERAGTAFICETPNKMQDEERKDLLRAKYNLGDRKILFARWTNLLVASRIAMDR